MFARSRILAGASAVALAAGTTLAGVGIASAQDEEESAGSLSSSSIDLGDTAASLELAAAALNGPVTVSGNAEGGPTVTYTNETGELQDCLGFTLPYSTIAEAGIDPNSIDTSDLDAAGEVLNDIDAVGGVSLLTVATEGEGEDAVEVPATRDSELPGYLEPVNSNGGILQMLGEWQFGVMYFGVYNGLPVAPGATVQWEATAPGSPAAAVILCETVVEEGEEDPGLDTYFGVDPQVVADQLNDTLPGGSIGAGSISGGSVGAGATVLGSLAAASSEDDTDGEGEADGGSSFTGISEGGSSSAEAEGEVELDALNAG
ncbi:hypothetical protein ACTHQW_15790 [Dietzia maris]